MNGPACAISACNPKPEARDCLLAVGADSEDKQELEPALLAHSTVVADIVDRAATIGTKTR